MKLERKKNDQCTEAAYTQSITFKNIFSIEKQQQQKHTHTHTPNLIQVAARTDEQIK